MDLRRRKAEPSGTKSSSQYMGPSQSLKRAGRENVKHVGAWFASTIVAVAIMYAAARPDMCQDNEACTYFHGGGYAKVHQFALCALATAFIMQFSSVAFAWKSAQGLVGIVRNFEYTFFPPLLLCVAFVMLILENLCLSTLFFVHVAADGVGANHGRPVYSPIIVEWLINVPILMVLSGNCALNRPLTEVSRPLIVTNIYIVISWAAFFVPIAALRWVFIAVAFIMYAWASYDMAIWVVRFRADTRSDIPARTLRCALSIFLIVVFFIYGIVFISAFAGYVDARTELLFWVIGNLSVKLGFGIAFVGIRWSQFYDLLVTLVKNKVMAFD